VDCKFLCNGHILGTSSCCVSESRTRSFGNRKIPVLDGRNASDGFRFMLDAWGWIGKGELGNYSCNFHWEFTAFPQSKLGALGPSFDGEGTQSEHTHTGYAIAGSHNAEGVRDFQTETNTLLVGYRVRSITQGPAKVAAHRALQGEKVQR
jgi:hypothetical protein